MQTFAISALSRRLSRKLSLPFFHTPPFKKDLGGDNAKELTERHKPEGLEELCQLTDFSRKELQIMYRGFKQDCPSGVATEKLFKEIFSNFFPRSESDLYAHYVFNTFDQDHDGRVSFEDFIMGLSVMARGNEDDKLLWVFSLYDINGDGVITKAEMSTVVSAVYDLMGKDVVPELTGSTVKDHVDVVFEKLDIDQDGFITLDEFVEACKSDEVISQSLRTFDIMF